MNTYVWLSQGRTFKPPLVTDTPQLATGPFTALAVADFDGDGNVDYIYSAYPSIWVAAGDGAGGAATPVQHADADALPIAPADFDRDGHLDALVRGQLFLGDGDGTFHVASPSPSPSPSPGVMLAAADFNEDGWPDVLYAGFGLNYRALLLWISDGTGPFKRTL